jgi:hypothetical protein
VIAIRTSSARTSRRQIGDTMQGMDEDELRAVRLGELKPLAGKIVIAEYEPE